MYVGDDLVIKVNAYNPLNGNVIEASTVTINAFNPVKDPRNNEDDRAAPDHTVTLVYEQTLLAYYGVLPTAAWTPGDWTLQTVITGELEGHEYRTVTLVEG